MDRRYGKYAVAWLPMVLIAVVNGAFREFVLIGPLDSLRAHQVSTILLLILFAPYIRFIIRKWRPASGAQAVGAGILWLAMTLVFEFSAGWVGAGRTWGEMLEDYNLIEGRLWILVPLWVAVAPVVFFRGWQFTEPGTSPPRPPSLHS